MIDRINKAFAVSGDKTDVPTDSQIDNTVSYEDGYTPDYQLEQVDPSKKNIERGKLNSILNVITQSVKRWQDGFWPDFISSADNGGTAVEYSKDAAVFGTGYDGEGIYFSLEDANTTEPTDNTKWRKWLPFPASLVTGMIIEYSSLTPPEGFLHPNGKTLGSDSSGSDHTGDVYFDLFSYHWTNLPNTVLPIQDDLGAPSTRGLSALADWDANKRLPLIDKRGRVSAGHNAMGNTDTDRLNDDRPGGTNGSQMGEVGGESSHILTAAEMTHKHETSVGGNANIAGSGLFGLGSIFRTMSNEGGAGSASRKGYLTNTPESVTATGHNLQQPTLVSAFIIKI